MDTTELVLKSQQNDRQAFNQLVIKYQDVLYNAVYRMAGNQADALDICQEAFIRAYVNIKKFKGKSSFRTWLYQIAFNQFYTHHQKTKKDKEKKGDYKEFSKADKPAQAPPTAPVENQEQKEVIQSALNSLSSELRKIIILKDIESRSYQDIAHIMKISVSMVRSRLCQARQELRDSLKKYL